MNLRIKTKGSVPRGGFWKYKQPETGEWIKSHDWETFLRMIKQHRRGHSIPVGLGFQEEIEAFVCEHQPEQCEDQDPSLPRLERLDMGDIVRGLRVIASFKLAGSPLVDKDEASRRAAICAKCRYNVTFSRPCSGLCPELKNLVTALIGNEGTPYDSDLRSCAVCKCYTSSHVWLPIDILDKGLTPDMRAQFSYVHETMGCWKYRPEWTQS